VTATAATTMPSFDAEIQNVIKDLGSKDWNVRFQALEKIQVLVEQTTDDTSVWTKDILVALSKIFVVQLKDLRSSIVREVIQED